MAIQDELVRRAQGGDRDALVRLVESEQAHVYTLALAVTRNSTDAADATQETFVRMLRSLNTFRADGRAAVSTWLHRLRSTSALTASANGGGRRGLSMRSTQPLAACRYASYRTTTPGYIPSSGHCRTNRRRRCGP